MAVCRSCDAQMVWAQTEPKNDKEPRMIPLDSDDGRTPAVRDNANLVIIGEVVTDRGRNAPQVRYVKAGQGQHTTHFATCEFADSHRRK